MKNDPPAVAVMEMLMEVHSLDDIHLHVPVGISNISAKISFNAVVAFVLMCD